MRSSGAGRKDAFKSLIAVVKQWIQVERTSGHTLSQGRLIEQGRLVSGILASLGPQG